jgi:hypothetical protein
LSTAFGIKDCALIAVSVNVPPVYDLRDLAERLEICPTESLYHHFCQTLLRPTFDDPEYHNDLAFWAKHNLHDKTLAERLAVLNPFESATLEDFRLVVLDVVEDRIGELPHISNVQTGDAFRFLQALTVTFETELSVRRPAELPGVAEQMTPSSIWYHFIDARRRNPDHLDDFTLWLGEQGLVDAPWVREFSEIDFYFMSLRELQQEVLSLFERHLAGGRS